MKLDGRKVDKGEVKRVSAVGDALMPESIKCLDVLPLVHHVAVRVLKAVHISDELFVEVLAVVELLRTPCL
jgi:hypothetical protein